MTRKKTSKSKKTPSKRQMTMLRKETESFTLRMAGASYQQIADQVGYADPSGAYRAFNRALNRIIMEEPDEMRLLELSRLDRIQIEIYRNATQGQLGAVDRYLKIAERRAKLMGIDAAERIEHGGIGGGPIQVKEVIIRGPSDDK